MCGSLHEKGIAANLAENRRSAILNFRMRVMMLFSMEPFYWLLLESLFFITCTSGFYDKHLQGQCAKQSGDSEVKRVSWEVLFLWE